MSVEINSQFAAQIRSAYFAWFTTVRADGMPQPTPVWFIWEKDTFLVYSMPTAQKVQNIRKNPRVALSFAGDEQANEYVVVMGEAVIDEQAPPANQVSAYLDKYREGIKDIQMTPESMAQTFSTAIRITPTHVRGE